MARLFTSDHHFFHRNILKYQSGYRPFTTVKEMNATLISRWNEKVSPDDDVYYLGDFTFSLAPEQTSDLLSRLHGRKYLIRGNHDASWLESCGFQWAKDHHDLSLSGGGPYADLLSSVRLCHYPYIDAEWLHMEPEGIFQRSLSAPPLLDRLKGQLDLLEDRAYDTQRALLLDFYGIEVTESDAASAEGQRLHAQLTHALRRLTAHRPRPDGRWLLHGHVHGLWKIKPEERMINVSVEAWQLAPVSEEELVDLIIKSAVIT